MIGSAFPIALLTALVFAAEPPEMLFSTTDPSAYEGRIIKKIEIVRKNVFDDLVGEDTPFYYRWANSLHIKTKERIVRNELLFEVGEPLDMEKVVESERNLRMRQFIGEAVVVARPDGPDGVDLTVTTLDYWSTKISLFSELGGGNYVVGAAASEVNFLGYGQRIELSAQAGSEQDGYSILAAENRLGGTRLAASLFHSDFTLGRTLAFSLARPQYSILVPAGFGISFREDSGVGRLFYRGQEFFRYGRVSRRINVTSIYSLGTTRRLDLLVKYDYDSRDYSPEDSASPYNHLIPPDEQRSYPSLGMGLESIAFDLARYLDEAGTPEDLTLGAQIRLSLGRSLPEFGSDAQATVPEIYARALAKPSAGVYIGASDLVRWWRRNGENREIRHRTEMMFYIKTGSAHVLALRGLTDFAWRQKTTYQSHLGGVNGLRGFPAYEFSGNRLALANLEYRFFLPLEILTVRFGGAAFFDLGAVWREDQRIDLGDLKSDLGLGLRFGLTRSSTSRVLRLDLARSLADDSFYLSFATGMIFSLRALEGYE